MTNTYDTDRAGLVSTGRAYYNEIDPYCAQWLRNLIDAGHIAPGVVDERSIEDVFPSDLRGFTQCHFFAGIGVWSLALRRAGWPDDRPVWTGSCPCQPFSQAGQGAGFADERHLWPAFFHLIRERKPAIVAGEQVASKDAEPWIDLVQDDMEGMDYAFGAVPFPAAGVGSPHIRDRLYWVAYSKLAFRGREATAAHHRKPQIDRPSDRTGGRSGASVSLADAEAARRPAQRLAGPSRWSPVEPDRYGATRGFWADADWIPCLDGRLRPVEPGTFPLAHGTAARVGRLRAYGNAIVAPQAKAFIESVMEPA